MNAIMEKGVSIIEASAGTGKTYTLCRIVLRLIAEEGIPIDRILAITFTQAATEELNGRIRDLLRDCLRQVENNDIEEPVLDKALEDNRVDIRRLRERLRHSLEIFDEASISTIHGFCKRCLDLASLETDLSFDASLEPIEEELVERLQQEYLRINIIEKSPLLTAIYEQSKIHQRRFNLVARECAAHPYASLEPKPDQSASSALERSFQAIVSSIDKALEAVSEIAPHLNRRSKLNKTLGSDDSIQALQALARRGRPLLSDLDLIETLDAEAWRKGIKKSGQHLDAPDLVAHVDAFKNARSVVLDTLVANYREWLFDALKKEKERRNIVSFNDLIHILNRALNEDASIARSVSERYDAALVDEFQDTDPTQYRIINRLFGDGTKRLFFIGDPKQAIYRFRGADIFAYFEATQSEDLNRIQLSDNYRSTPKLVAATNALFASAPDGFAFDQIEFSPVSAARPSENERPMRIHAISRTNDLAPSAADATALLAALAAQDLAKRASEDPEFDLGKVAFLVNRNAEADLMMQSLARHGIDSVIQSERSVFQSEAAEIMRLLVEALAAPTRSAYTRALLISPLCGFDWIDLQDERFENRSEALVAFLRDWSRNWYESNFDSRFQAFLSIAGAPRRLLANAESERLYSDLQQLSELLQAETRIHRSSPFSLLAWLDGKSEESVSQTEAWQTRLRSDDGKPQIVTVHKSKGLQFPIVIYPFLALLRPRAKREHAIYHSESKGASLVIDLAPEPDSSAMRAAEREEYAEHLRLIYVAITRAVDECELYLSPEELGANRSTRPSSFCQLLLGSETAAAALGEKNASEALINKLRDIDPKSIAIEGRLFSEIEPEARTLKRDTGVPAMEIHARFSSRSLPAAERILSFSTLTQLAHSQDTIRDEIGNDEPTLPDRSDPLQQLSEDDDAPEGPSLFNLPKGANTGNLIHNILEEIDFQNPKSLMPAIHDVFARLRYGFSEYKPIVHDCIERILEKSLSESIRLQDIPSDKRIAELEFAYPTGDRVFSRLASAFTNNPNQAIPQEWVREFAANEAYVRASMMRGFVDLVFEFENRLYILDWKTNHLGNQASDYSTEAMTQAMAEHDYFLQYCLYCVALKRHIERRNPHASFYDQFGGVFYIFVRGIESTGTNGIFFDRPPESLLEALDKALAQ